MAKQNIQIGHSTWS